jgi:hypothetical protein
VFVTRGAWGFDELFQEVFAIGVHKQVVEQSC